MFLAQGMAFPGERHQEPLQMRMAFELDPEHVVDFTLVPVGVFINVADRMKRRILAFQRHLEAHVLVAVEGQQVVHQREIGIRLSLPVFPGALVDGGQVVEHAIGLGNVILKESKHLGSPLR